MAVEGLLRFAYEHLQVGWSIISLPLGLFAGYRFHVLQDERKDWNALTHDVSKGLRKQIESLERGQFIHGPEIDTLEITEHLSRRQQRGFLASLKRYREAHGDPGTYNPATGGMEGENRDMPKLLEVAKALHRHLERR